MATWRVHVTAPDADKAKVFKEKHFKLLYAESGAKVTFEVPHAEESKADAIIKEAKAAGFKAEKEEFQDPLEDASGVDFW